MFLRNFPLLEFLSVEIPAFSPRSLASFLYLESMSVFSTLPSDFVRLGGDTRMSTEWQCEGEQSSRFLR